MKHSHHTHKKAKTNIGILHTLQTPQDRLFSNFKLVVNTIKKNTYEIILFLITALHADLFSNTKTLK